MIGLHTIPLYGGDGRRDEDDKIRLLVEGESREGICSVCSTGSSAFPWYPSPERSHPSLTPIRGTERAQELLKLAYVKRLLMKRYCSWFFLKPSPQFNANTQREMILSITNFTCYGNHNEDCYDVKFLWCYINVIFELKLFLSYSVAVTFRSLIMWNGQVKVRPLCLSLHLACVFCGIYLVKRSYLLPGLFLLRSAWMMIASMNGISHHPSPWQRRPIFLVIYLL